MRQEHSTLREEPPCIWAQAGVLSYRPCDRHYECDGCPLFRALQGGPASAEPPEPDDVEPRGSAEALPPWQAALEAQVSLHLGRLLAGCTLHLDRAYSSGHWWVEATEAPDLTLGIEGLILRMLDPVDDIVAPRVGVWLRRSEPCGLILRGHASIPLRAPISGEVTGVNGRYLETLRVWGNLSVGDDWLIRLRVHEDPKTVPGLYRGDEALGRLLKNIHLLKHALREAVGEQADRVGATLADGGEPVRDLETVLGRARFEALIDAVFHSRP